MARVVSRTTVGVLAEAIQRAVNKGDRDALDTYPARALARVWKAQQFSYWMTTTLHSIDGATEFDERRQVGELASITGSAHGAAYLAEAYTGWPTSRSTTHRTSGTDT